MINVRCVRLRVTLALSPESDDPSPLALAPFHVQGSISLASGGQRGGGKIDASWEWRQGEGII